MTKYFAKLLKSSIIYKVGDVFTNYSETYNNLQNVHSFYKQVD
jgi:hypothetical protein